jgi:hypothetical protein
MQIEFPEFRAFQAFVEAPDFRFGTEFNPRQFQFNFQAFPVNLLRHPVTADVVHVETPRS